MEKLSEQIENSLHGVITVAQSYIQDIIKDKKTLEDQLNILKTELAEYASKLPIQGDYVETYYYPIKSNNYSIEFFIDGHRKFLELHTPREDEGILVISIVHKKRR